MILSPKLNAMRLFFTILFCITLFAAAAQTSSKIADKTKNFKKYDGYFPFWWDAANGKIWLLVDKLDKEFLYVNSLPAGLGNNDIGLDRGLIGGQKIVYFNKVGKKLLLVQPNYAYRASSADANEKRAVKESFAQSVIASFVVDEDEGDKVLVDATSFFFARCAGSCRQDKKYAPGYVCFQRSTLCHLHPEHKKLSFEQRV